MLGLFVWGMFPSVVFAQEEIVDEAIVDLSRMLNVSVDEITVDSVMDVIWLDTSLGCSENSTGAAAVLVAGWRITLNVDGEAYYYHADKNGRWFYCPAEYSMPGIVPLSVDVSNISTLPSRTTVQTVFLVMVLGTLCALSRVQYGYECKERTDTTA